MNAKQDKFDKFPNLKKLMAQGDVWRTGKDYIGRASDGVEVYIGTIGEEKRVEAYLTTNPTPKDW